LRVSAVWRSVSQSLLEPMMTPTKGAVVALIAYYRG